MGTSACGPHGVNGSPEGVGVAEGVAPSDSDALGVDVLGPEGELLAMGVAVG